MKFTWGTGILVFLIVFLTACGVFIFFAMRQQVNLVHKDYYEKGVDYSQQMEVNARSKQFARSLLVRSNAEGVFVEIEKSLAERIDSGTMHMFRPSDKTKDIKIAVEPKVKNMQFPKKDIINGRYILKFTWYMEGTKYEVDQPVNVQ